MTGKSKMHCNFGTFQHSAFGSSKDGHSGFDWKLQGKKSHFFINYSISRAQNSSFPNKCAR